MFSLINLILTIFVLIRVYKTDKFFSVYYQMSIKESDRFDKSKFDGKGKRNN